MSPGYTPGGPPHAVAPLTVDEPDSACYIGRESCQLVSGIGGYDRHHEHPKFLDGPDDGPLYLLCPAHHRRIHAAIRAMVEADDSHVPLRRNLAAKERELATAGYEAWVTIGKPDPASLSWSVAAAKRKAAA